MKSLSSAVCPKCGIIAVEDGNVPCSCCRYSPETELTLEEAREFTFAGD